MDKNSAKGILGSRVLVTGPGKYVATTTNSGSTLIEGREGQPSRYLQSTNLVTPDMQEKINNFIAAGDFDKACNQSLTLQHNVRLDGKAPVIPSKNSRIYVHIDYVKGRDEESVLRITGWESMPVSTSTSKLDLSALDVEVPQEQAKVEERF